MIQELLGGASLIGGGGERKISILETPPSSTSSPSFSPSNSTTSAPTTTTSAAPANPSAPEHLRCPRCDSSNTKFCYYNNYNLTQPRHFCKTCRRYWTKGGALRNVPIGGGCRKNKNTPISTSVGKSNGSNNKMRTMVSEIGRSGAFGNNGFEHHEFASSPIFWASAPQNSHLLNLLRATGHNPNPNPNSESNNSFGVKDEGCLIGNLNHLNMAEPPGGLNGRTGLGFDPLAHVPSLGLCSPLWKNSQQNGVILGEAQNSGIQELYQRLRSASSSSSSNNGNYYSENLNTPLVLSNVGSSSSSNILESSPVAGSELGFWNSTFSWSDLPTTNGAYP